MEDHLEGSSQIGRLLGARNRGIFAPILIAIVYRYPGAEPMSSSDSLFTLIVGFGLLLSFWFLIQRAHGMRTKGRDLMSSGVKDMQSGRQKMRDGRKSLISGTLLLSALIFLLVLVIVAALRTCAVVPD